MKCGFVIEAIIMVPIHLRKSKTKGIESFVASSNILTPIYCQPDGVNRLYFKLRLIDLTKFILWNIYSLRHGCKDVGIRKPELVSLPFQ